MIGTILIVLVVVGALVGGFFIYKKYKATIQVEAAKIAAEAKVIEDALKADVAKVTRKSKVTKK